MMKATIVAFGVALAALAALAPASAWSSTEEQPKPERFPSSPSSIRRTQSRHSTRKRRSTPSSQGAEGKKKVVRLRVGLRGLPARRAARSFLCKKGTKEHEAIVRIDADAQVASTCCLDGGRRTRHTDAVHRPQDRGTEVDRPRPARASRSRSTTRRAGKTFTHPAQEWIWDTKKKAPMNARLGLRRAASSSPIRTMAGSIYGANSGDIISISNFPYSLLEIPSEVSKDDAQPTYEVKTDKVPPLLSKVWKRSLAPEKKG